MVPGKDWCRLYGLLVDYVLYCHEYCNWLPDRTVCPKGMPLEIFTDSGQPFNLPSNYISLQIEVVSNIPLQASTINPMTSLKGMSAPLKVSPENLKVPEFICPKH